MSEATRWLLVVWPLSALATIALAVRRQWPLPRWVIAGCILGPLALAAALEYEQRVPPGVPAERAWAQRRALGVVGGVLLLMFALISIAMGSVAVTGTLVVFGLLAIVGLPGGRAR